jgi:hypothetical protein
MIVRIPKIAHLRIGLRGVPSKADIEHGSEAILPLLDQRSGAENQKASDEAPGDERPQD